MFVCVTIKQDHLEDEQIHSMSGSHTATLLAIWFIQTAPMTTASPQFWEHESALAYQTDQMHSVPSTESPFYVDRVSLASVSPLVVHSVFPALTIGLRLC